MSENLLFWGIPLWVASWRLLKLVCFSWLWVLRLWRTLRTADLKDPHWTFLGDCCWLRRLHLERDLIAPEQTFFGHALVVAWKMKNKFEVSKIYMTACMCIYKFCQIKKYMLMIFFCSKTQMIFVWIFMIFHVLLHFLKKIFMFYYVFKKVYSRFFRIFQDISRFFKIS